MGVPFSITYKEGTRPKHLPAYESKPTYDPEYGFKVPRKERGLCDVSQLTIEEMKALKIPKSLRHYCAHGVRDLQLCLDYFQPAYPMCKPEYHALQHCIMDDRVLRMKEYEREKRLRLREARKEKMAK